MAPLDLVALHCRTSETSAAPLLGARALGSALGERLGLDPQRLGEPPGEAPRAQRFEEDLRDARPCLEAAGARVEAALERGEVPVLAAGECSVAVATLTALARARPDASVLWLDAHGDLNTPRTTGSGYLGGMALAGACGLWDTGFEGAVAPGQVVLAGVRDLDPGEQEVLVAEPFRLIGPERVKLDGVPDELGHGVFVHLDLDVLDDSLFPTTQVPVPGGPPPDDLRDVLTTVGRHVEVIGVEIAGFAAPDDEGACLRFADLAASLVEPLVAASGPGS